MNPAEGSRILSNRVAKNSRSFVAGAMAISVNSKLVSYLFILDFDAAAAIGQSAGVARPWRIRKRLLVSRHRTRQ
jgi:hypothetical protein